MTSSDNDNQQINPYNPATFGSPHAAVAHTYNDPQPGPTGQVPFNQPAPQEAGPQSQTNTLAVISAALSLSSIFTVIGFIPGIILGHMANREIKQSTDTGRGWAITGLVVGYVFLALWVALILITVLLTAVLGMSVLDAVGEPSPLLLSS